MKKNHSLTPKIVLSIISVIMIALFAILYVSKAIVLEGFARLEKKSIQKDIKRVENSINSEFSDLTKLCEDWAPWDDTREFMLGKNLQYEASNKSQAFSLTCCLF